MSKTVYMCVSSDEYELPLAIADTQAELARLRGVHFSTISAALKYASKRPHNVNRKHKYIKVEIDE